MQRKINIVTLWQIYLETKKHYPFFLQLKQENSRCVASLFTMIHHFSALFSALSSLIFTVIPHASPEDPMTRLPLGTRQVGCTPTRPSQPPRTTPPSKLHGWGAAGEAGGCYRWFITRFWCWRPAGIVGGVWIHSFPVKLDKLKPTENDQH